MLILTRRPREVFTIEPDQNTDLKMTLGELFAEGPLYIAILGIHGNQIRIGVDAPADLLVLRKELRKDKDAFIVEKKPPTSRKPVHTSKRVDKTPE